MATTDYRILKAAGFSSAFLRAALGDCHEVRSACVHALYQKRWTPDQCKSCAGYFFACSRSVYDDAKVSKTTQSAHEHGYCSGACFAGTPEEEAMQKQWQRQALARAQENHAFFESEAWKRLRYAAIRRHGARCQACGATRQDGAVIQVDHVKPRSTHPELALVLDNLQVLCRDCNLGKSNLYEDDWRNAG